MERNGFEMREERRNTSERKVERVDLKMWERGSGKITVTGRFNI